MRTRWGIVLGVLGVALGLPPGLRSQGTGPTRLAKALSSGLVTIEEIESHRFEDLDRDGVREVLVRGRGSFPGAFPDGALAVPLGAATGLLASGAGSGRFVGVFAFDRETFRWAPSLVARYASGDVLAFDPIRLESGSCLVRLAHLHEGRVFERLYRPIPGGLEQAFHFVRGNLPGEGLWVNADKLLVTRALADPFAAPSGRPGFLARTRYHWNGAGFTAEDWSLSGLAFKAGLELPPRPRWEGLEAEPAAARRKAWDWQRAADRGAAPFRKSLAALADHRLGTGAYRIVQERQGLGVVIPQVDEDRRPRYFVQPFLRARGGDAAWVGLDEVGEGSW